MVSDHAIVPPACFARLGRCHYPNCGGAQNPIGEIASAGPTLETSGPIVAARSGSSRDAARPGRRALQSREIRRGRDLFCPGRALRPGQRGNAKLPGGRAGIPRKICGGCAELPVGAAAQSKQCRRPLQPRERVPQTEPPRRASIRAAPTAGNHSKLPPRRRDDFFRLLCKNPAEKSFVGQPVMLAIDSLITAL